MKPIIVYPLTIDWDYLHQRPQQLMKALSLMDYICVFCNPNLQKKYSEKIYYLTENLILANEMNFTTALQWAKATYPSSPFIAYFTYPPQIEEIRNNKLDIIWFDSVDEPVDEFNGWLACYEESVRRANIVTASARSLVARASPYAESQIVFLPNGCDYEHFKQAQNKQPLGGVPFTLKKPVIGYIGAMAPWIDWCLIHTMAHFLPDYEFVLIGPLLLQTGMSLTSSNMHYLGPKSYEILPAYMSRFDFCLIPFALTEMTKGVNPIKFWEYLASGIPILSTQLPEIPREYVTIVSEESFPGFSPRESSKGKASRIELAKQNDWEKRAGKVSFLLHTKLASV